MNERKWNHKANSGSRLTDSKLKYVPTEEYTLQSRKKNLLLLQEIEQDIFNFTTWIKST